MLRVITPRASLTWVKKLVQLALGGLLGAAGETPEVADERGDVAFAGREDFRVVRFVQPVHDVRREEMPEQPLLLLELPETCRVAPTNWARSSM
jgi:hypothetical protein